MSDRLELRHVEHLMDVCGDSHDALMLLGTMAVVATVIKQRDAAEQAIVRCEKCGFGYSAEHSNADGSYSCPLCELRAAEDALTAAREDTRMLDHLDTLASSITINGDRDFPWMSMTPKEPGFSHTRRLIEMDMLRRAAPGTP